MTPRALAATLALVAVPLLSVTPGAATAQGLAARMKDAGDGTVRFHFDAKPGVEVCDQGIRTGPHRYMQWHSHGWDDDATNCHSGFLEVEVRKESGRVDNVKILTRRDERTPGATEVGEVAATDAAHYLLGLARSGATSRGAERAILPAVLADAGEVWPDLMTIARDRDLASSVRRSALFWIGQAAGERVAGQLSDVATADDEEQGVRDAAVFALSQRPADESVPALMDLARTARQAKTRKTALFWLAQSKDPRVLPFFEQILLGKGSG